MLVVRDDLRDRGLHCVLSILHRRCGNEVQKWEKLCRAGLQYSIGDAGEACKPAHRLGGGVLSILHWRCRYSASARPAARLIFFQYSIGDARPCFDPSGSCLSLKFFQYSIGDAKPLLYASLIPTLCSFNTPLEMPPSRRALRIGGARVSLSILHWRCALMCGSTPFTRAV